jgi:Spy/CpxP family protein refolding chaperone
MGTIGKTLLAVGVVAMMAAPASAQQGRGFGGGFGGGGGAMLLTNKGVQKELKVTDEQASKLEALAQETMEKQREQFGKLQDVPQEERREKMQAMARTMNADLRKSLDGILKPEQVKRFEQIQLQQSGTNAFTTPRVVDALKLTDDQKSKIQQINDGVFQSMRDLREEFQSDREGAMKKMADLRKQALDKSLAVLTDSQKATWKELNGEPFEVKFEPRPQN